MIYPVVLLIMVLTSSGLRMQPVMSSSVQHSVVPSPPILYQAANVTKNSATITWSPYNDSNFARYEVRRAGTSGNYGCSCTVIATIHSINQTSIVAENLAPGITYYFIVRVFSIEGLYADSNEINVTALQDPFDLTPPSITIMSPQNITYGYQTLIIEWETDEPTVWMGYSLDGGETLNLTEGVMLNDIEVGPHSFTLFAKDGKMNLGNATVHFTVDLDRTPPTIYHESPGWADEGTQITLFALIVDDEEVTNASVFYRLRGETTFVQLEMLKCPECDDIYNATFMAPLGNDTTIEYYISASDRNGNGISIPSGAPLELFNISVNAHPLPVQIISPLNATESSVLLVWEQSNATDFLKYTIFGSQDNPQGSPLANITSKQTSSYLVEGLTSNTTYYFYIRVFDSGQLFSDSPRVAVNTLTSNQNPNGGTGSPSWLESYGLYLAMLAVLATTVLATAAYFKLKRS
ncbi:MAG: fibronectin type III domain-containing protein [Candidatus Methanomethylicus sp.]|nr:fibronectin type III domain-containing protein [Candidatus Methanomethylicus sp.]